MSLIRSITHYFKIWVLEVDICVSFGGGSDLFSSVYLFVADEIYASAAYLKNINGIYSVKELTRQTLLNMADNV